MKRSSFFPSLGLLLVLNLLIKPLWIFGIDREVQNEVGTSAYGTYFSLLGLSVFFNFLLDWGLTVYYNRQLAADPVNFTGRAGSYLLVKFFFSIAYGIIVLTVAKIAGVNDWHILIPVIIIQALTSIFVFLRSIVTAKQWFHLDAWMSVVDKALMILVCGSFIYFPLVFGKITLQEFLLIQIICTLLSIVIIVIILLRNQISFAFKNSFPGKEVFRATLPYAIIVLLMSAHYRFDGFLLERLHPDGDYQAGLYAGAYRLLDAANMIGFLFASFLLPYLANLLGKRKEIQPVVLGSRHLLIVFSLFISITVFFKAPWLQNALYDHKGDDAVRVMQWCLPVLIVYSLVHVYGTVLTARTHLLPLCYILLVSVGLNITLNLLLIEKYGAIACCISALVSQGFCGIAAMIYARKKSGLDIDIRSFLIYIFIAGLLIGLYYMTRNFTINQWFLVSLAGIFTLGLAYQFSLIDLHLLKQNPFHKEENEDE
jgi:O-antigen/teichoic acid export membrane protein